MSWLGATVQLLGVLVLATILCALDGLFVFFPAAAVAGFLAWIFGAASPRAAALTVGALVGGLWGGGQLLWKIGGAITAVRLELQKRRIAKIEQEP